MNVVAEILEAGLSLTADGERLLVWPAPSITPTLRILIQQNKPLLLAYARDTESRVAELVATINRACLLRGDDDENRLGLIRDCSALPPDGQQDMTEHFANVAATWARASDGHH